MPPDREGRNDFVQRRAREEFIKLGQNVLVDALSFCEFSEITSAQLFRISELFAETMDEVSLRIEFSSFPDKDGSIVHQVKDIDIWSYVIQIFKSKCTNIEGFSPRNRNVLLFHLAAVSRVAPSESKIGQDRMP